MLTMSQLFGVEKKSDRAMPPRWMHIDLEGEVLKNSVIRRPRFWFVHCLLHTKWGSWIQQVN